MLKKICLFLFYSVLFPIVFVLLFMTTAFAAPVTPHGSARFETPNATININNNSGSYKIIWMNAIRAWNRTGAFNFSLSGNSDAQVIAESNSGIGPDYSGLTRLTINNQAIILQAECTLNPQAMASAGYLPTQETNVAEHELGHAIGLYHNPNKQSVMFAANRFVGIKPVDIAAVKQLYATSAGVNLLSPAQEILFRDPIILRIH